MNPNNIQRFKQLGNLFKGIKNPQQAMIQMLKNNSNPMAQNVLKMAENGQYEDIEKFARNVVSEQGKDFDTEISNFKNMIGL